MNAPEQIPETPRRFRAGSLVYTRMGLFVVCAWLLWGDFAFNLMEVVAGSAHMTARRD